LFTLTLGPVPPRLEAQASYDCLDFRTAAWPAYWLGELPGAAGIREVAGQLCDLVINK